MNCSKKVITLSIALFGVVTAAVAQDSGGANPQDPPLPQPLLARHEVAADLKVWRESGAAAVHRENEGGTDFTDPAVQQSVARYETMRTSPSFAKLVAQMAEDIGGQRLMATTR